MDIQVGVQMVITVLIGIVTAGVGWWVNNMWAMLRSQQEQIVQLNIKLSENYLTRVEFREALDRVFAKLDEIQRDMKAR